MYTKITNPKTGRKVSINSSLGKNIIRNYLNYVNEQELELNEIEQQKSSLSNTFFKDIKDNHTNTSNNTLNV